MKPSDITAAFNAYREATKGNTVSEAEFDRRAEICKTPRNIRGMKYPACPYRRPTTGVGKISAYLGQLADKHGVTSDVKGYQCGICGCGFSLLLASLPENLHKDSPSEANKRPEFCWMKDVQ